MTDRISLTAAELAFLLSVRAAAADATPADAAPADAAPAGPPTAGLLGFGAEDRTDALLGAGLGSLLLRHLAAPTADQRVELAPAIAAVADGLGHPRLCVKVALVADQLTDGALYFESGAVRFLLAPRAYRCFDVTGVDPALDRRDVLVRLAGSFLERYRPGVASFTVVLGAAPLPAERPGSANGGAERSGAADAANAWATLAVTPEGTWTFATGRVDGAEDGLAPADALARLAAELDALAQPQVVTTS
jgi:hypothetical protein